MLCQNCNLNEASIHLYTNVNGNQQQVDLCQNCYKIMKSDPKNPLKQEVPTSSTISSAT